MKIGRILKYVVGSAVILLVALVVVVTVVDFNDYKPEIQAQVKQATGRDLTIEGDIGLALSLTPTLDVSGVSFANAAWGSRPEMAKVERFEVQVALIPLISGNIDIQRLVLIGADILLETNPDGQANYVFETAAAKPVEENTTGAATIPVVRSLVVEKARVTYADGVSKQTFALVVDKLTLKASDAESPIALAFDGAYNDNPISASGTLGSRSAVLSGGGPVPIALVLQAGGAKVVLDGIVADIATAPKPDLKLTVEGESLATLSSLAGAPVPPLGPYSIAARLSGDIRKTVRLDDFAATVGGSDLSGAMSVALGGEVPAIDGTFRSKRIDIADLAKGGSDSETAPAAKDDGRVFPDDPLPLDGLKAVDAAINLTVETLVAVLEAKNVALDLTLKGGDLRISRLKAIASDGAVDGTIRLNAASATPAVDASVQVTKFDAGRFLTDMNVTDLLEGRFNVNIDVKGRGNSVRAIMASLDGKTQVAMGSGRMKSTALDSFIGGPTKFLTELVAGKQSEYTVINCVVSQFDIAKGLATSKALVLDTEYATIAGTGTIDLATEALDLEVDPKPKSATINTAVPVEIAGTLANPSYSLNKFAAARKVGGLVGGFAFPPALILGLGEIGTGGDNPCLDSSKAKQVAPAKEEGGSPASNPLKSIGDSVGGTLKKLFGN